MPNVFICHGSGDKNAIVAHLAEDLRGFGLDVWYDDWEIKPGESLRARIISGLESCDYFLIVLSKRSVHRPWVQFELDSATIREIEGKARVVPLVYGTLAYNAIPLDLRRKKYLRFRHGSGPNYDKQLDSLVTGLVGGGSRLALAPDFLLMTNGERAVIEVKFVDYEADIKMPHKVFYEMVVRSLYYENRRDEPVWLCPTSKNSLNNYLSQASFPQVPCALTNRPRVPLYFLSSGYLSPDYSNWKLIEPHSSGRLGLVVGEAGVVYDDLEPPSIVSQHAVGTIKPEWLQSDIQTTRAKVTAESSTLPPHFQGVSVLLVSCESQSLDATITGWVRSPKQCQVAFMPWHLAGEHIYLEKPQFFHWGRAW